MENKWEGQDWNKKRQCEAVDIFPVRNAEGLKRGSNGGECQQEKKACACKEMTWHDLMAE